MLGSMYSAVSGLQAHQTKMNVIGNNIANVNTYGFKASRVTFSDVFYQTMSGASSPSASSGGTNPLQLGYGTKVSSIDVINTRAGSATTDRALDVYINGDGYLPVKDSDGVIKYTRVGVMSFDESGNLVDRNGNMVLGFRLDATTGNAQLDSNGTTSVQNLGPIHVDPAELDKFTGISIGKNGEITAIKEGDPAFIPGADTAWMSSVPSVTNTSLLNGPVRMTVSRPFTAVNVAGLYTGTTAYSNANIEVSSNAAIDPANNSLSVTYDDDAAPPYTLEYSYSYTDPVTSALVEDDASVTAKLNTSVVPNTVTFTGIRDVNGGNTATITIPISTDTGIGYNFTDEDTVVIGTVGGLTTPPSYNIKATTTDKAGNTVPLGPINGWTSASSSLILGDIAIAIDPTKFQTALDKGMTNFNIGSVQPGPGEPTKIGHMATVKFINQDGLEQDGEGYCVETTNSGNAVATIPGNGGTGNFRSGALEMSNVDLSKEFTEMIITQRGFQANTRMITTSDEMLSELVSMKR